MKTRKILALVLSIVMVLALCGNAFAAHLTDEVTELEATNSDIAEQLAEQTYVLLENNGALPIAKKGAVALFGSGSETTIKGGTGSGDVNQRKSDAVGEAFVAAGYTIANPTWFQKMADTPRGCGVLGDPPKTDLEITDEELAEAAAKTDTAIYVVARNAGEGDDRAIDPSYLETIENTPGVITYCGANQLFDHSIGYYYMTELELENMQKICDTFDKVIVVYNSGVVDTTWQAKYDIDAVVYMGNGGQRGSEALVNCLNGTTTFSGKLTDTWAESIYDYPSTAGFAYVDGNIQTEWYSEGIYMGYRYFDTFGKEVSYPFGYGLSYTDFDIDVTDVKADGENVTVTVDVTNIGSKYSGKEVVQVYFSAPAGALEKPYQELAAYGKTDELAPGQKQTMTISFKTADLSSYQPDGAYYVIEDGDYIIRVGNSSRNTVAAAVINVDADAKTELMYNQFALEDGAKLDELSNKDATPIANNDEAELADAIKLSLKAADIPCVDHRDTINDEETITTYLLSEDFASYEPREEITLRTKTVPGIIQNAEYPNGDGTVYNQTTYYGFETHEAYNGYQETTYKEVKEDVGALPEGITKETATLTDVYEGKITLKQFVACLTPYELARLCVGGAAGAEAAEGSAMVGAQASAVNGGAGQTTDEFFYTRHIPAMPNADGPAGVRITQHYTEGEGEDAVDYYQFCTAFPVGTNIAQSWDIDVYKTFGTTYGSEMKEYGVTTCLCPGMDMHRNPLNGRNFEYYSEDPLVAGYTAAYFTLGVQSHDGIGVCLKHFWGNEQEDNRDALNNVVGERAAREIYLKQFEIAVKLARPQTMMNCYNENNGWPGSDSWDCNEDVLRGEWGFTGYVMTDWGGGQSTPFVAKHGGCDMVMPGGDANVILRGLASEPTFNEDGSIADQGSFVFDADQGEPPTYTVPTNVTAEDQLPDSVKEAIAAGYAKYQVRGSSASIGWYGHLDLYNKICIGDLQKSAMRILQVDLESQDMEKMMDVLGKDYTPVAYSENNGAAALAEDAVPMSEKSEVTMADGVIVAADVVEESAVPVTNEGAKALTSVRLTIACDLPIVSIDSENDFEFNPDTNAIVVYKADGTEISNDLFTINFDTTDAEGTYPVVLSIINVTSGDELIEAVAKDGSLTFPMKVIPGDVDRDGDLDNADLIMIARYLVDLEEFDDEQKEIADFNDDGTIDNIDLVLIARELAK